MSKLPKVSVTLVLGICGGCNAPKSVLLSCFNGSCSEKCAKAVARRNERQAERKLAADLEAQALAAKETAEVADWADRLRKGYERLGRTFGPLPTCPREARAALLKREKFILAQKASERKLRGR